MLESHFSEHIDNPKVQILLDAQNNTFRMLLFDGGVINTVLNKGKPKNIFYSINPATQQVLKQDIDKVYKEPTKIRHLETISLKDKSFLVIFGIFYQNLAIEKFSNFVTLKPLSDDATFNNLDKVVDNVNRELTALQNFTVSAIAAIPKTNLLLLAVQNNTLGSPLTTNFLDVRLL